MIPTRPDLMQWHKIQYETKELLLFMPDNEIPRCDGT
jgi:hypothetical protein